MTSTAPMDIRSGRFRNGNIQRNGIHANGQEMKLSKAKTIGADALR